MTIGDRTRIERRPWRLAGGCLLLGVSLLVAACGAASTGTFHPGGPIATSPDSPGAITYVASKLGAGGLEWPPFGPNVHVSMPHYRPADKAQRQAVIADEDFLLAYEYGLYKDGRDTRWQTYVAPSERAGIEAQFASPAVRTESFIGTVRIWRMASSASSGGAVRVAACVDTFGTKNTNYATGRVLPASKQGSTDSNYSLESYVLARRHGRWQVITIEQPIYYPSPLARPCKP